MKFANSPDSQGKEEKVVPGSYAGRYTFKAPLVNNAPLQKKAQYITYNHAHLHPELKKGQTAREDYQQPKAKFLDKFKSTMVEPS